MKKSLKLLSCILVTVFAVTLNAPLITHAQADSFNSGTAELPKDLNTMNRVDPPDYEFLPASQEWISYVSDQKPAELKGVTYSYTDNVMVINKDITDKITSAGQLILGKADQKQNYLSIISKGGYISKTLLDQVAEEIGKEIDPGCIVVDESTDTAFKVVAPVADCAATEYFRGNYAIAQPELSEIISDFKLPEQTVSLTRGNITGFAKNVESNLIISENPAITPLGYGSNSGYKYISKNPMIDLSFNDVTLEGFTQNGSISVKLSGGIGIDGIDLTAKYSGFSGYKIGMIIKQECYLEVSIETELKEEVWIPILGIDLNLGIGRIAGGLFVVVNLDGTLRLQIEAREYTKNFIGISGKTAFYVPVSFKPAFQLQEIKTDGDVSIDGKINGAIRAGAMMSIELFGLDLVGAGAFIGAGLNVAEVGKNLDIEVYGIVQANVSLLGKHFRLVDYRPTILEKKQRNTGGLKVEIKEAFIVPGLVGGLMQAQTDDENDEDGYVPATDIEYRIKVVPEGVDPDIESSVIRYYPKSTDDGVAVYDYTTAEGIFIRKDVVCKSTDRIFVEFKKDGSIYECDPVSPWFPFKRIVITQADYFSEFATGQVEPVKTIWWEAPEGTPEDERSVMTYYENGIVAISLDTGGMARTQTDEFGFFNTQNPLLIKNKSSGELSTQYMHIPNIIDIRPNTKFEATIDIEDEALLSVKCAVTPTVNLEIIRVVEPVKGTFKKTVEGGKVIHSMQYNEYIWIVNHNGTRAVTSNDIIYKAFGYSTEDLFTKGSLVYVVGDILSGEMVLKYQPDEGSPDGLVPKALSEPVVYIEKDENGNQTGSSLLSTRFTLEWVWQPHSNPVAIISEDHATFSTAGGKFKVEATGKPPLVYSIKDNVPAGVTIDKNSGEMTIPGGLPVGNYVFTVVAKEFESLFEAPQIGPYKIYTEDHSEPDEQKFALTIQDMGETQVPAETTAVSETTTTQTSAANPTTSALPTTNAIPTTPPASATTFEPSATTTADATTAASSEPTTTHMPAPVIAEEPHGYRFEKSVGGGDLVVPINATGGGLITFSVHAINASYAIPVEISINPNTGVLTVKEGINAGTYNFVIRAENAAGADTQTCEVIVSRPVTPTAAIRTAPVIAEEVHNYEFRKQLGSGDMMIQVNTSGSAPITFSLFTATGGPVPDGISIDPATGLITISDAAGVGRYSFTIKAENDIGSDTQNCLLEVFRYMMMGPEEDSLGFMQVASTTNGSVVTPTEIISPALTGKVPENFLTIRNDHETDLYSKKQNTVNGAAYIRWESEIDLFIEGGVTKYPIFEDVPLNDHHLTPFDPDKVEEFAKNKYKEQLSDYQKGEIVSIAGAGLQGIIEQSMNFDVNQSESGFSFLEYGSMLDLITSTPGGSFNVDLGGNSGTVVTGKYFDSLKGNKNGSLAFTQQGATVTFKGKDINNSNEYDLFNFGFSADAPHKAEMLASVGTGQKAFTFSFAHHGELPGMATFEIATDMAQGTKVNVYKYDTESAKFSKIAGGLTVGSKGSVTYKNKTMSEYLITTATIPEEDLLGEFMPQSRLSDRNPLYIGAIAAIVLLAIIALLITAAKKKAKNVKNSN